MHVCPKQSGERKNKNGVWGRGRGILSLSPPPPECWGPLAFSSRQQ